MGQGLGKDSPVVLTLGRANYEALIDRHGQWIRWRKADKCPCVSYPSMQPDIRCSLCGGRGEIFSTQEKKTDLLVVGLLDFTGTLDVGENYIDSRLVKVYDSKGIVYKDAEKLGQYITLGETPKNKGEYFNVVLESDIQKIKETAETEKLHDNYYRIKDIQTVKTAIEGIYYTGTPDIDSIEKVIDSNGVEYEVSELRLDTFRIEPKLDEEENIIEIAEPVMAYNVKYTPPFIFALLSQNISKADAQVMVEAQGDAIVTFPYNCDVANGDVLTVLSGTITEKGVQAKTDGDFDTLPDFFVSEIVSIASIEEGQKKDYINNVDYALSGTNRIKWLTDNQPTVGEAFSVTYKTYPTYKVVKDIPQLRTAENQRFPKKAVVKLYKSYAEKIGVNTQRIRNFENF